MKTSIIIVFTIFMFNHTSCNMKNIEHKDFTVNPYIGAEPILFGMDKQKIKEIFVNNVISGPNTHGIYFVDDYSLGLSYDSKGLLDRIDFHYRDSDFRNASVFWEGVDLFTLNSKQLIALLKEKDPNLESSDQIELAGFVSQKYGIAFGIYYNFEEYGDDTKELNEYWSSIILFKKGKQI